MSGTNIYIDGNNLYRSAKALGFEIDYKKFRGWLGQKYDPQKAYLFLGFISAKSDLYEHLHRCGFILVFKETAILRGAIKGNCDAELILEAVSDLYTQAYTKCILISGDGDFGCLIAFLSKNAALYCLIIPDISTGSFLLTNQKVERLFLNDHYQKFSQLKPKRGPDADASA